MRTVWHTYIVSRLKGTFVYGNKKNCWHWSETHKFERHKVTMPSWWSDLNGNNGHDNRTRVFIGVADLLKSRSKIEDLYSSDWILRECEGKTPHLPQRTSGGFSRSLECEIMRVNDLFIFVDPFPNGAINEFVE